MISLLLNSVIMTPQVYVPCTLIVILSWVGFWLNRCKTRILLIDLLNSSEDASHINNVHSIVYVPDILSTELPREATSDRITLGVTAVLTLSAISLDSRSDLPKVE